MTQSAWDILGIAESADNRTIRRAYAARLKTSRPEDDAAAFQVLTDAYEWAMGDARRRSLGSPGKPQAPSTPPPPIPPAGQTEVAKGMALGADAYVTKPFSTKDLVAQVAGLLNGG